jgi:hypothetical protein
MTARKLNYSTRCLLFGTPRTNLRWITPGIEVNWAKERRGEIREGRTRELRDHMRPERREDQIGDDGLVRSHRLGRSYVRVTVVIVSVIVNELSNKTASFKPQKEIVTCPGILDK